MREGEEELVEKREEKKICRLIMQLVFPNYSLECLKKEDKLFHGNPLLGSLLR